VVGALKVRTSTAPDVWTTIGGGSFATAAETIAGTVDTKAVTPAGREAASTDIDPRKYGFATTATGTVNSTALQAAINEACGVGDPVTTSRFANRRVVLPAGTYLLDTPITIRSVLHLEVTGLGNCELRANANMTTIFDINGISRSRIGGFTLTGSAGVQVDNGIYYYWDAAGAQRTSFGNSFHDISIRNLDFVTGIRVGKPGASVQVDSEEFRNIIISGAWTAGETARYQAGLLLGSAAAGNNLIHHVYRYTCNSVRYPLKIETTEVAVYGAGIAGCEAAIWCQAYGFAYFNGFDVEGAQQLLFAPASTANVNLTLSDVKFRANSLIGTGRWIDFNMAGTLHLKQLYITNATVTPIVATSSVPTRVDVEGLSVLATTNPTAAQCFVLGAQTVARVRGFVRVNASSQPTLIEDWTSDATAGQLAGMAPSLVGKTGEYWSVAATRGTAALLAGTLYAFPVFVPIQLTVDRIGVEVTTLAAGSTVTLGIYDDNGVGLPGNLLIDAGTIDGGVVGAAEKTISQLLPAGRLYHFAALCQGGTPTMRVLLGGWQGLNTSLLNAVSMGTGSASFRAGRNRGSVSGTALPTPAGSMGLSSSIPAVAVRIG
jgi:predicted secreted protein